MNFVLVTVLTVVAVIRQADTLSSTHQLTQAALVQKLRQSQLNKVTSKSVTTASERLNDPTAEYSQQTNFTARFGLQKCTKCQTFGIVGAGPSGLVTGLELALAGHTVTVFEANNRTGGRVWTHRNETTGLYMLEMGAMRLPLDVQGMLSIYLRERLQLELEPYINYDPDTLVYVNDVLTTRKQANDNPGQFGFNLYPNETNKSASTLWNAAVKPITDLFYADRWTEALEKWDGYSIERYLLDVAHFSPDAIRFVTLLTNLETSLYTAILDNVLLHLIINDETTFYHIKGGNSGFTDALVRRCQAVPNGRCSIRLSTRVTAVELGNGSATITYGSSFSTLSQNASETFDNVIIATTATAASRLDFRPRRRFINTYYALRQLHYDCASKIGLYFTRQWWRDIGIDGGYTTTDLPIRTTIYFSFPAAPSPAALLASYSWSQDSIVWSTVPEDTAIALALEDVQRLHTGVNISQYFDGGITKHWCQDMYTQGGTFTQYAPYQETKLKGLLSTSIDNVHFTGEHISSAHAWIEGAILSALRLLIQIQEETFDVAIIGDDLVSLTTALRLAQSKPAWRIALIAASSDDNGMTNNTDEELSQFRSDDTPATQAITLWRALEAQANVLNGTFLNLTNGYLFLTEGNSTCFDSCQQLNGNQIETRFGFHNVSRGLFYPFGGFVNMTAVRQALNQLIANTSNIVIRHDEYFVDVDTSVSDSADHIRLITNRGSLNASRLVLVPGRSGNNISEKFGFHLDVRLWELPTNIYRVKSSASYQLPTWRYDTSFFGFPMSTSTNVQISPLVNSTSATLFTYPNQLTYVVNPLLITNTNAWVTNHLSLTVNSSDFRVSSRIHVARKLMTGGNVLDRLPACARYGYKTFIYADESIDGSTSPFIPVWADMLTQLVLGTSSNSSNANLFFNMNAGKLTCDMLTTAVTVPSFATTPRGSSPRSYSPSVLVFLFILFFYVQ